MSPKRKRVNASGRFTRLRFGLEWLLRQPMENRARSDDFGGVQPILPRSILGANFLNIWPEDGGFSEQAKLEGSLAVSGSVGPCAERTHDRSTP